MIAKSFSRIEELKQLREYYPDWTFRKIAEATNLSYAYVRRLASQHGLHRFGPRPRKGNNFVTMEEDLCPLCKGKLVKKEAEQICFLCGYSKPELSVDNRLPFDTTFTFTNNLAFGKSLGNTEPFALHRVLALNGTVDLPIRTRQIKIMSINVEPKFVKSTLEHASRMLKEMGLDSNTPQNHELAHVLGGFLRRIGAYIIISKIKCQPHQIARASIFLFLSQMVPEKAEGFRSKHMFKQEVLEFVKQFQNTRLKLGEGNPSTSEVT